MDFPLPAVQPEPLIAQKNRECKPLSKNIFCRGSEPLRTGSEAFLKSQLTINAKNSFYAQRGSERVSGQELLVGRLHPFPTSRPVIRVEAIAQLEENLDGGMNMTSSVPNHRVDDR